MARKSMYLIAALILLASTVLVGAQAPAGPAAGGQAPAAAPGAGGPGRGAGRGPAGPPQPANVAFHNERNDMRHQTFVDIAKKGGIDLLFVGDSITDWFYWPRGNAATGGKVWEIGRASCRERVYVLV